MEHSNKRQRESWKPPARPEWVRQVNKEGNSPLLKHLIRLDENSLMNSAREMTGLTDFGDDDWIEPFRIYINALENEANLHFVGRMRAREQILYLLKARLEIEETYKRHPEIEEEQIVEPIIIVGQGRSGTSYLVNLLSSMAENGYLSHWEAMIPCPPPEKATYESDPRIEVADSFITQINRIVPSMEAMHEFGAKIAIEDVYLESICFRGPSWMDCFGQVPSYDTYMATQDPRISLRYHKRVLKLLQWQNPRKRWALKDVLFLDKMEQILEVYPDACFVWPHRDPVKALASTVSLIGTFQWATSDTPFIGGSYEYATDLSQAAARLNRVMDKLDRGIIPGSRIYHLLYSNLVTTPIETIEKIYGHFGFEFDWTQRSELEAYIRKNPREARPSHEFSIGSREEVLAARSAFEAYQQKFDIPEEI